MSDSFNREASGAADPTRYLLGTRPRAAGILSTAVRMKHVATERAAERKQHRFAFAGLLVFTALLYLRPHEMFPDVFGTFPLVKIVAGVSLLAYFLSRVIRWEPLSVFPIELKMLLAIMLIGLACTPLAVSPQESMDVIFDLFIKVVAIFVLMINVITSRRRLLTMFGLVVICGAVIGALAINSYVTGDFKMIVKNGGFVVGMRIFGPVGGIVGNPNDLAISLDMLLPLAVVLGLLNKGLTRAFFFACGAVILGGVVVTFSRGGFLGLITLGAVLMWKVGRENRAMTAVFCVAMMCIFALAVPSGYTGRISSILHIGEDPTGSSQARRDLLERAVSVAAHHPIIGVGMGNYHTYSIHEQVSHNSYLETAAELGLPGLLAYLVLIFAPIRSLRRIERGLAPSRRKRRIDDPDADRDREVRHLTMALQAVLFAYVVCSFFGSIQYQWFLYYPVAYVIALRGLYQADHSAAKQPAELDRPRGVLWRTYQRLSPATSAAGSTELRGGNAG